MSGASANSSGRVRKNSIANNSVGGSGGVGSAAGRPRANTIGHLDLASLGLLENDPSKPSRMDLLGLGRANRMSMSGLPAAGDLSMRDMANSMGHNNAFGTLPKLETQSINHAFMEGPLRTAPAYVSSAGFDFDQLFPPGAGNTINPAQLHFPGSAASPSSPFPSFPQFDNLTDGIDQVGDDFSWMRNWGPTQLDTTMANEHAIEESSSYRIHSARQAAFPDGMIDAPNRFMPTAWPSIDINAQPMLSPAAFRLDNLGSGLPLLDTPPGTVSPQHLHDAHQLSGAYFNGGMATASQTDSYGATGQTFVPPAPVSNIGSDSPSISSSMTGSARQSSVTSVSTASITDATRQALLISLSQPSVFGNTRRKYSVPSVSSPLSPGGALKTGPGLPSTADLQRYVNAYIQYFHPHLPFLHIPTLAFDSSDYLSNLRSANAPASFGHAGIIGGGGCLILAMAAIGALYEYDHQASRELFDNAKRMIQLYLEERRKSDMSAAVNGSYMGNGNSLHNTPLWLVQAMLLNVIYGHNCGDKTSADIASTHCAALVSLARAAELARPPMDGIDPSTFDMHQGDMKMENGIKLENGVKLENGQSPFSDPSHQASLSATQFAWCRWKETEERKRTLFAVFTLSSLLVTAYNHTPAIMNSEILLDLPCEEELWAAESANDWLAKGGSQAAEQNAMPFSMALSTLLTANQRAPRRYSVHAFGPQVNGLGCRDGKMDAELRPSTFGCLVLINALHNYIWETRSRHHGRQWTAQESDSMFSHIEPALNAWQAAWKANDRHRLHRPNPFGTGPLSADSIPLLDLAFVRLFVNLGRAKEAFWQRDFDTMSNELARGTEIVQHAAASPGSSSGMNGHSPKAINGINGSPSVAEQQSLRRPSQVLTTGQGSKRERHLRKAAFYAADSLTMSSKFALTYADATSHELPIQAAMCFFDCSQVLAEWASTIQERVGRYLGVLGREDIDYTQVPAIMLLETEDVELLSKIENICTTLEEKMIQQANMLARELGTLDPTSPMNMLPNPLERLNGLRDCGLGAKMLRITAYMLEKAAVWPGEYYTASAGL